MNSTKPALKLFAQNHAGELVPVELVRGQLVPSELASEREPILTEVDRYLDEHAGQRSASYTNSNEYVLRQWAADLTEMGCTCVQEIDTPKMQAWFAAKSRRVKIRTARAYNFAVQHFLNWARDERRLVILNAAEKVKIPRHTRSVRRNFIQLADAQKLIDHCVDEELRFALYCALHAGFRFGEVVMARPEWFDMEHHLIHIRQDKDWAPKNGKDRSIPMSDEFYQFLEAYGRRGPFMIQPQKLRAAHHRYRFDFKRRYERLIMQTGVNASFHDLRRTFCSLKVSAGVSLFKVATWAGHRIDVCQEHYAFLIPADNEIERGLERKAPAPEVKEPELPPHLQQTWEELRELVWEMPLIRAARLVGLSDQGLRKKCYRLDVPLPPQGYWSTPPERREKFLARAYRSHHGLARGE